VLAELIKAVAVISLLGGALTLLILAAEALVANYGVCRIDINKGKRVLEVEGGGPLLAALLAQDIFIPSACGGRGSCGVCKVTVTAGGGPVLPTETPYLAKEELARGVRLSCQCKVRSDLAIEIPEELFSVREYEGVCERIADLTHDIKELRIRLVTPQEMEFRAGQYVQFRVPEYDGVTEPVYRAYSISTPPADKGSIELIVRLVPEGICTTYVFKHLKQGDAVRLNGPYGEFSLRESDRRPVFIAGGSGIAPIKAILFDRPEEIERRNGIFFFGAVARKDLAHYDLMRQYASDHPKFTYVPALSKPAENDAWEGETGLITQVVDRHIKEAEDIEAYLCGSPGMIDACIEVLHRKGVPDDLIFYDKFA